MAATGGVFTNEGRHRAHESKSRQKEGKPRAPSHSLVIVQGQVFEEKEKRRAWRFRRKIPARGSKKGKKRNSRSDFDPTGKKGGKRVKDSDCALTKRGTLFS